MHSLSTLLLLAAAGIQAAKCSPAKRYTLMTTYDATNFFDKFNFRDAAYYNSISPSYEGDPTRGSVNYLNKADAMSSGLARIDNGRVRIGVDATNVAAPIGSNQNKHGRKSVRLESQDTWNSGIMIADIQHMPGTACGVWPSLWSYNFNENPVGEIDIIEGMSDQRQNVVSLHTCGTCDFSNIGGQSPRSNCNNGGTVSQSCEDATNFDGCGTTMSDGSYGTAFNNGDGGVYATVLDTSSLRIWWWPRNQIPADITAGNPDPTQWGTAAASFLSTNGCNVSNYFKGQTIIINTSFCGENMNSDIWNSGCQASTGAATCDDYVTNNPAAFAESYWSFNSIKIYA